MKRFLLGVTILGALAVLGGCPVYPDTGNYIVCTSSECFDCPDPSLSGACVPWLCNGNVDCGSGYMCTAQGWCAPGAGIDAGGGTTCPCPDGYLCKLTNGSLECIAPEDAASSDASASGPDAAAEGAPAEAAADVVADTANNVGLDALPVPDVVSDTALDAPTADAAEAGPAAVPCNADSQCGELARCVDGECTVRDRLCSDTTQCLVAGESCVDGLCTPHCSASAPCPTGFACDFNRNVCSVNPASCTSNAQCQGGTVCVEAHCAAPCSAADSAACPTGQICVNGGCIPEQRAQFSCLNDGVPGQLATTCDPGSVCLHGDCYPLCALDGGGCAAGTACKHVTITQGTFAVCATATNLGSDCDPATGKTCSAGAMCIDGYCK